MEQKVKNLPVPSLTPAQVEELLNYANELPTKFGVFIINKIQEAALQLEKAAVAEAEAPTIVAE